MLWTRGGALRSGCRGGRGFAQRPIGVRDEMNEFYERSNALRLAPRCEHVMSQVVMIVVPPVVLPLEDVDGTPRGLDGIHVVPGDRIDEVDAVIDIAVRITQRIEIAVCTPTITDDGGAGFDPVTYNVSQCVSGSIRYGNKKCSARLSFNTAKHLLFPELDGKMSGTPVLTKRLVTEGYWFRIVWTLKNWYLTNETPNLGVMNVMIYLACRRVYYILADVCSGDR